MGGATELVALPTGVVAPVPSLGPVIDSFGRFCADLLPCKSTGAGSALHRADYSQTVAGDLGHCRGQRITLRFGTVIFFVDPGSGITIVS